MTQSADRPGRRAGGMNYLSVCSGIEAASVAWHPLGWKPVAFSEIDPFPSAVLAHHFPETPNWGDMTKFKEWPDANVDVLVGGTPCQSFSVAGLRKGLDDPRGNLALTYLAIADKYRPKWVLFENVPGIYTSTSHTAPDLCPPGIDLDGDNGPGDGEEIVVVDEYEADESHAFACFLAGLSELGYGYAVRTLDAQFVRTCGRPFAVPQRRRRVFVVGYFGDWRPPAAVLIERESMCRNPPPRRQAGKGFAADVGASPARGSHWDGTGVHPSLNQSHNTGGIGASNQEIFSQRGAGLVCMAHGQGGAEIALDHGPTLTCNHEAPIVAHTLKGEGYDASEDGTGRGVPLVPVAFDCKGTEVQYSTDGSHPTLRSMGHNSSHQNGGGHAAVAFDLRGREGGAMPEGPHQTANLRAASGGSSRSYVAQPWAVRRLSPVECERLQGFPDGFTDVPYRNRKAADGPRYKALGNSMAVNCMEYIGRRIALVEDIIKEQQKVKHALHDSTDRL